MKVVYVLYNAGNEIMSVPFNETRIAKDMLFSVPQSEFSPLPAIVKVTHIPICMLACLDPEKLNGLN